MRFSSAAISSLQIHKVIFFPVLNLVSDCKIYFFTYKNCKIVWFLFSEIKHARLVTLQLLSLKITKDVYRLQMKIIHELVQPLFVLTKVSKYYLTVLHVCDEIYQSRCFAFNNKGI